jgi:hypothetical protein
LFDDPLVFIMRTDPDPDEVLSVLNGECPVMRASSRRPKLANLFEV